jgi:hypothetical protein
MVCGQFVALGVEREELLTFTCQPCIQRPAELRRIEGMQRLTELKHHIVRDIDDVVIGRKPTASSFARSHLAKVRL